MKFQSPLRRGRLLKRYKRFLSDVVIDGPGGPEEVVAHCANPGSMMGLAEPGSTVWLLPNNNPKAKLDWRWELTDAESSLVCINTSRANQVIGEALAAKEIAELRAYETIRPEVKYGQSSRIDFLLQNNSEPDAYVEVKSVTLSRSTTPEGRVAEFPDAQTKRGTKHLHELIEMRASGNRAVMLFLAQRGDCTHFRPARDIDPVYADALTQAVKCGVEVLCYSAVVCVDDVAVDKPIPVYLD